MIFRALIGGLAAATAYAAFRFYSIKPKTSSSITAPAPTVQASAGAPAGTGAASVSPTDAQELKDAPSYEITLLGNCGDRTAIIRINGVEKSIQSWFNWINAYYFQQVAAHPNWSGQVNAEPVIRIQPDQSLCWYSSPWASYGTFDINLPLCEGIKKFFQQKVTYGALPFTLGRTL